MLAPYSQQETLPLPPVSQYSNFNQSSLTGWHASPNAVVNNANHFNEQVTRTGSYDNETGFTYSNSANVPQHHAHALLPGSLDPVMGTTSELLYSCLDAHPHNSHMNDVQHDQLSTNGSLDGLQHASEHIVDQHVDDQQQDHDTSDASDDGFDWVNPNPSTHIRARKSTSKLADCVGPLELIPHDIELTTAEILT
jgi:hypothetical protein